MKRLIDGAKRLGLSLSSEQVNKFETYYQELVGWNKRVNLTSIVDYEEVQVLHFLDSLTALLIVPADSLSLSAIDVGSGGGLPGIPLKIVCPSWRFVLVDSVGKKTAFLRHVIQRLGLADVQVITERAENLAREAGYREQFDLVLSRAVASLPTLLELTLPFCRVGGLVVAHKSKDVEREINLATKALALLGGRLNRVEAVPLEEFAGEHVLVVVDKVAPTPEKYPRRAGIPKKRPL